MNTKETAIQACEKITDPDLRAFVLESIERKGDWVNSVQAFHRVYDCPDDTALGTTVGATHMTDERLQLRLDLLTEEAKELEDAVGVRDEVEMADALGDIIYVAVGFALELGIDLGDVVQEIQASNMTKLDADGNVVRREDGKVLKGPDYKKPDIKSVLRYRD